MPIDADDCSLTVAHEAAALSVLIHLADALTVPDGGFSVSVESWRDARVGYAVSVFPDCEERITGNVRESRIARYLAANAPLLAKPNVVLGGWRNPEDNAVYLDVSIVVPTRAEAVALAKAHGQVAIWDFAACRSIPLVDEGMGTTGKAQLFEELAVAA